MRPHHFLLIILCIATTQSSIYSNIKDNVLSFLQRSIDDYEHKKVQSPPRHRYFSKLLSGGPRGEVADAKAAEDKTRVIKKARNAENQLSLGKNEQVPTYSVGPIGKERYLMDPVLNFLKRRRAQEFRRKLNVATGSDSSSLELEDWKDEWSELWLKKKFNAINSTEPRGDVVNMVAARPWGTPCGDPNQHDMPWGSCMLPMECDGEFRIYRGDYFCGRTTFVCCSLQYTNYDLYQGFDVSFDDSSFSTDSNEKKELNSKEAKRNKKRAAKRNRDRERANRKRAIKNTIKKIIREMQKILNRAFRNGTLVRKRKTRQLKKYVNDLKKKYRKERKLIRDLHELEMIRIDGQLLKKLKQMMTMNEDFARNSTFRDIVVNGTITKQGARMLIQAYPELEDYMDPRLTARRIGGGVVELDVDGMSKKRVKPKDYLEYDIEYGLLYS